MKGLSRLDFARCRMLFALAIAVMAAAMPAAVRAQTAQNVGTITQLTGAAGVQRGAAAIPAASNMPVQLHDRITTQPGASLTIGMVDNSSLQLGPQATLVIDDSMVVNGTAAPSKVGLLGGSLHSLIVGAMRGSSPTFEVHTPNAVGAVRGTEFDTTYSEGVGRTDYKNCLQFTDVAVQQGVVNVSNPLNPGAPSQDIHAGKKTTVACGIAVVGDGGEAGAAGAAGAVGKVGLGVLGAGAAAGAGVGIAAGAGAFNGGSTPPKTPNK